jgi:hypothetical protein
MRCRLQTEPRTNGTNGFTELTSADFVSAPSECELAVDLASSVTTLITDFSGKVGWPEGASGGRRRWEIDVTHVVGPTVPGGLMLSGVSTSLKVLWFIKLISNDRQQNQGMVRKFARDGVPVDLASYPLEVRAPETTKKLINRRPR